MRFSCEEAKSQFRCIILTHIGLHEQARTDGLAALGASPDDAMTLFSVGNAEFNRNEFDAAREYFARTIAADPSHLWARLFFPLIRLYRGDAAFAEERLRSARQLAGDDPMVEGGEALLWAIRGEKRKASQMAKRVLQHRRLLTYTHHAWHSCAAALAQIGKPKEALNVLRKTTRIGLPDYPLFRDDPFLAPLRQERGFIQLMAELKNIWDCYRREFDKSQS